MRNLVHILLLLGLVLQSSCANLQPNNAAAPQTVYANGRLTINNNLDNLNSQIKIKSTNLTIKPVMDEYPSLSVSPDDLTLTLVAEIAPPVINGKVLQANCIRLWADFAYVGYNCQGAEHLGAVDVIHLKNRLAPELRSRIIFNDTDINGIDGDNQHIYCAESRDDVFGNSAQVEVINLNGGKIEEGDTHQIPMISYAGTCAYNHQNALLFTSGNQGGLYAFDQQTYTQKSFINVDDARWIESQGNTVAVIQGTPGRVSLFNFTGTTFQYQKTYSFNGANVPEAKSNAQIVGDHIFIAAGRGGVQVHQLVSGTKVTDIPLPEASLDPDIVTNEVTIDGDLIFIANGGAGVYVAKANDDIEDIALGSPMNFTMIGQLQLAGLGSVNHMVYDKNFLFVATGTGGFKVIQVTSK